MLPYKLVGLINFTRRCGLLGRLPQVQSSNHTPTFSEAGETSNFSTFVTALNQQLKSVGMELARAYMEDSGQVWYGLVNRREDAAAKLATTYSPAELNLFNKAVSTYFRW